MPMAVPIAKFPVGRTRRSQSWQATLRAPAAVFLGVATAAWLLSLFRGVCYAGDAGFFVLTDGYVVVHAGGARTWGDWGWWTQEPWIHADGPHFMPWLPMVALTRQIGAAGLHIPLTPMLAAILGACAARRSARAARDMLPPEIFVLTGCGVVLLWALAAIAHIVHPAAVWFVLIACVPSVAVWLMAGVRGIRLNRRRYPEGCCSACGYDLRGTVSGHCSECGLPISHGDKRPASAAA